MSLAAGAFHWLPSVLQPFLTTHPEVRFRLTQRSLTEVVRLLDAGEVGYCFVPNIPPGPGTGWRQMRTGPISPIVRSSRRFAGPASVGLGELAGEETILGMPGNVLRRPWRTTSGRSASPRTSPVRRISRPPPRTTSRPGLAWRSSRAS